MSWLQRVSRNFNSCKFRPGLHKHLGDVVMLKFHWGFWFLVYKVDLVHWLYSLATLYLDKSEQTLFFFQGVCKLNLVCFQVDFRTGILHLDLLYTHCLNSCCKVLHVNLSTSCGRINLHALKTKQNKQTKNKTKQKLKKTCTKMAFVRE